MHDRLTSKLSLFLVGLTVVWLAVGSIVVPRIITAAYNGDSWTLLNGLIVGQHVHGVEFYLQFWKAPFGAVTAFLIVATTVSVALPRHYLKTETLVETWKNYWFVSTSVGFLAVARILCAGFQFWILTIGGNLDRIKQIVSVPVSLYDPIPAFLIFSWPWGMEVPPPANVMMTLHWVTVGCAVLALVGFRTKLSMALLAFGSLFQQGYIYSFGDLHHREGIFVVALLVLALSPCGKALSIDAWLEMRRKGVTWKDGFLIESIYGAWGLRVVQTMFGVIYLDTAVKKMTWGGLDWMNGDTLQYYLFVDGIGRGSAFGVWLAHQHSLVMVLSIVTIIFEATFWVVIFAPRLTWVYLLVGTGFHLGNAVTGIAPFYHFVVLYVFFLPQLCGVWRETPISVWKREAYRRNPTQAALSS